MFQCEIFHILLSYGFRIYISVPLGTYNEDNVCKMEFYDETDPFHIQWYRTFVSTINFHWAMRLIKLAVTAKKDSKEMKRGSSANCATSGFMMLVLKSNQHLLRSFSLFCGKVFMFIWVFYYLQFSGKWLPLFFLKIIYWNQYFDF